MTDMKTMKDLAEAFAGESQANRKYLAFAQKADEEGYPQIARLFRATAEAETIHALAHLRNMGAVKSTAENLKEAMAGEIYEFTDMYPPFIEDARSEGEKAALRGFQLANEAEKVHADLYGKALENLDKGEDSDVYLCPFCGHVVQGEVTDACPICGAKASAYRKID